MPTSSRAAARFGAIPDSAFPWPSGSRRSAAPLATLLVALLGTAALPRETVFAQTTEESAAGMSTGELMRACAGQAATGERSVQFCDGFIIGAGLFYLELRRANLVDAWACATPVPTIAQVREGFVAWARDNPQHMGERAINGLWRAMAELYPCER